MAAALREENTTKEGLEELKEYLKEEARIAKSKYDDINTTHENKKNETRF